MLTNDEAPASDAWLYEDGSGAVIACSVVFILACTISLILRFVSLRMARRRPSLEDWVMVPAWVIMMGLCAISIWGVKEGNVGRHQAWVKMFEPATAKQWAQTIFGVELMYGTVLALEKTSILLLYVRIFGVHKWFRITIWVLVVYIWLWGLSVSITSIASCSPVTYQWDKSIAGGTCVNQLAFFRWHSFPNIAHDVVMLILPAPMVWQLQISGRQKLALMTVFLVGSMGCIASVVRMYYFFKRDAFADQTWASIQLLSWTIADPGLIYICASLPALSPLLRLLPGVKNLFSKSSRSTRRLESSQRSRDMNTWTIQSHSNQRDDFVPLADFDERVTATSLAGSDVYMSTENGNPEERGKIRVTREITISSYK